MFRRGQAELEAPRSWLDQTFKLIGGLGFLVQLLQQPFQLSPGVCGYGAIRKKARLFPGVFVLQLGVHFAANDQDFEAEAQLSRQRIRVFLGLGFRVTTDRD